MNCWGKVFQNFICSGDVGFSLSIYNQDLHSIFLNIISSNNTSGNVLHSNAAEKIHPKQLNPTSYSADDLLTRFSKTSH